MSNHVDIIFCRKPEMAEKLREFLIKEGYAVAQSTVQIQTGTHGLHEVKRLDVLDNKSNADITSLGRLKAMSDMAIGVRAKHANDRIEHHGNQKTN